MPRDPNSLENRNPVFMRTFARVAGPPIRRYFRPVITGLDNIPNGAALFVGNHNGGMLSPDTFTFCNRLASDDRIDDIPYGLAHENVFRIPGIAGLLSSLGAIRASHENAHRLFSSGRKALVYPGGDVDAWRSFADRKRIVFGGRRGYIRLALREGVPIVPLVSAGAHEGFIVLHDGKPLARALPPAKWLRLKVWPVIFSLPWGVTVGPAPPYVPLRTRIHQEVLPPLHFERSGEEAAADDDYVRACDARVQAVMQEALTRLYAERDAAMAARRRAS